MYERIEAEESLVSCLLTDWTSMEKIYGMLSPDMFDEAIFGAIFNEYHNAFDENKELSLSELQQLLEKDGYKDYEIEDALTRAVSRKTFSWQITGHANAIVRHWKKTCVDNIIGHIEIMEGDVDNQIEGLITDLESLRTGSTSKGRTVADIVNSRADDYFCDKEKNIILLDDEGIDTMTGGFQGGDLILCGARPGTGKSALGMQWAWVFAKQGYKVGYYNCEMQEEAVLERLISSKTGIPTTRVRLAKAFLNDEEQKYRKAVEELSKQDRIIIFTGSKKVSDIRADMREHKFDVIIIDYLQLLFTGNRYQGNRVAEVGELSRDIKCLAMDFDIPVIALSQLSRATEGRSTKEPQLSDLRESGSLEQDASIVFFLWDKDEQDRSQKGFKTAKSRNGICGRYDLVFNGSSMTFKPECKVTPFDGR